MLANRIILGLGTAGVVTGTALYWWSDKIAGITTLVSGLILWLIWVGKHLKRKSRYELRVEREGRLLIVITLAIGFAALNTGSNLLYLVLGLLLSLIVASGMLSQLNLRRLVISSHFHDDVHAQVPCLARIEVRNPKQWMPTFNLIVRLSSSNRTTTTQCFFEHIEAAHDMSGYTSFTFPRRGKLSLSDLEGRISTQFPFGLFTKHKRFTPTGELLIYPSPHSTLDAVQIETLPNNATKQPQHLDDELDALKPFADGDDLKRIHWKKSTATEQLIVREGTKTPGVTWKFKLARSASAVPFDPLEEAWISRLYSFVRWAERSGQAVELWLGDTFLPSPGLPNPHEQIARALAELDTRHLPSRYADGVSDVRVIDISKPPTKGRG
ncbi:MAG: DUF58 domain-containing protein [Bradymonadia bacterium]